MHNGNSITNVTDTPPVNINAREFLETEPALISTIMFIVLNIKKCHMNVAMSNEWGRSITGVQFGPFV